MTRFSLLSVTFCVALAVSVGYLVNCPPVAAQQPRDAASKSRGQIDRFWVNQRTGRSIQHARDYSRDLYQYSRDIGKMTPAVAKSESEQLGKNIEAAKQGVVTARKAYADDKQVQAALNSIQAHLDKATAAHKQLHSECCKDAPDSGMVMHCCSDVTTALDKAAAEHAALLRMLEQREHQHESAVTK